MRGYLVGALKTLSEVHHFFSVFKPSCTNCFDLLVCLAARRFWSSFFKWEMIKHGIDNNAIYVMITLTLSKVTITTISFEGHYFW